MATAVYGSGVAGSFTDPVPFQYTLDAVQKKKNPKFTVNQILGLVKKYIAGNRVVAFEFRKFPGPPSVGPQGFQTMTPIPATIYVRNLGKGQLGIEIERSGFEPQKEQISAADLSVRIVKWLKMAFFERVEFVDSTDFKVVIARRSQIFGIEDAAIPVAPMPQSALKMVEARPTHQPDNTEATNQWLLVLAIVLFAVAAWSFFRSK